MGTVRLVIPEEPTAAADTANVTRSIDTKAIRLGLLDNSKGNADHLLAQLAARLKEELPVASVVTLRKPGASKPAEARVLDELAQETDFVISAMAD
jgi:hypothetical protein